MGLASYLLRDEVVDADAGMIGSGGTHLALVGGVETMSHVPLALKTAVADRIVAEFSKNPRGAAERYVTLSAGVASLVPPRELALDTLGNACRAALQRAKAAGKNTVVTAESADFK